MNTNPQRHVVSAARMLQAASKELSSLIETLSPSSMNGASHRNAKRTAHKVAKQAPAKAASSKTVAQDSRHLTEEEREAAKVMLLQTALPVSAIAKALDVTRASIYNLRDRFQLNTRKKPAKRHASAKESEHQQEHTSGAIPA